MKDQAFFFFFNSIEILQIQVFIDWILPRQRKLRLQKYKSFYRLPLRKKKKQRGGKNDQIKPYERQSHLLTLGSIVRQFKRRKETGLIMCVGSVQPNICHSPGCTHLNKPGLLLPAKQNSHSFPKCLKSRLPLSELVGQKSLYIGFLIFHMLPLQPQKGQTCQPLVKRVVRTMSTPKPPWSAGTLRTSFSKTLPSVHVNASYPSASGNKQNKWCSSENTDILHHFDILLQIHCYLKCSLPPSQLQFSNFFHILRVQ